MTDFLATFDNAAHAVFLGAGIAAVGTYTPKFGGVSRSCKVMVDEDPAIAALAGVEITIDQTLVRVLYDGMPSAPVAGDTIAVGTRRFVVVRRVRTDTGGSWVFICQA